MRRQQKNSSSKGQSPDEILYREICKNLGNSSKEGERVKERERRVFYSDAEEILNLPGRILDDKILQTFLHAYGYCTPILF